MKTTADIIRALGADAIAARLQVSRSRVRRVMNEPLFPASWYIGLCELAALKNIKLPATMFTFNGIYGDEE